MRRSLRGLAWTGGAIAALVLLVLLAVQLMVRTPFGMERARRFAADWLRGQVNGEVEMGWLSGDGLLGGVVVHEIAIRGPDGREFVTADSLAARYGWLQFARGNIVVDAVDVFGATVRIEKLPGDSLWNYQRIFAREDDGGPPGPTRLVRFDDVRLHGSRATIALPDESADPGPFVTENVQAGRVRLLRFSDIDGWLGPVLWQSPDEPGKRIRIRTLNGLAGILEAPAHLTDVEGNVTIRDSVTTLDLMAVRLPGSRFGVTGRVIGGAEGTRLDLRGEGAVSAADFTWLHPRVPRSGEAQLDLRVETLADGGLLLRSERLDFRADDARIDGAFGWVAARTPALQGVDLRVARAEVSWLDSILPVALNTEGRLSGRVRADGPLNGLRTSGDLRLQRPGRDRVAQASWSGGLAVRPNIVTRRIEAELIGVDLDILEAVRPGLGLGGYVDGRVSFDGPLGSGMEIRAVVSHHHEAGASTLDGVVTVATGEAGPVVSGRVLAEPIRLEAVSGMHPQLAWLRGQARGAVAFDARRDSVRVGANLAVGDGRFETALGVELRPDRPYFDGTATLTGFAPVAVGAPAFAEGISGVFDFRLSAGDLLRLAGSARAELDSARVRGFPLQRSSAYVRFADGVITVDSAVARAPGLFASSSGTFGLVAGRAGELEIEVTSGSLEPLEAVALGGIEDPTQPRMGGTLAGGARLRGSLAGFDLEADADVRRLMWGDRTASRVAARLQATGVRTDSLAWRLRARSDTVAALGVVTDSAAVTVDFGAAQAAVDAETWSAGRRTTKLAGSYTMANLTDPAVFALDSLAFVSGAGLWTLQAPTRITFGEGTAGIDGLTMAADSGGTASVTGRIAIADIEQPGTRPLDFRFDLSDVAFSTLPGQVRPVGVVSGVTNGRVRLTGTATEPVIDASFSVAGLAYQGARLDRLQLDLSYRDRRLEDSLTATIDGREVLSGAGFVPVDLRLGGAQGRILDEPMDMTVRLNGFPAAFAFGLVQGFTNIQGAFEGQMRATGSARDPRLSGAMALIGAAATWDATGVRYVDAEGTFQIQEDLQTRVDLSARTVDSRGRAPLGGRGGTARVTGTVDLTRVTDPGLDLVLAGDRMLATRRREAEIVMSGEATLRGRYRRPVVGGALRVDGGSLYIDEIYRQYLIVGLEDPLFLDVVDTSLVSVRRVLPPTENPFLRNLLIEDMRVSVGSGSWLRSREMDVEVSGNLIVEFDRLQSDLRMSGTLEAQRGTYRLEYPPFARVFEVRDGTVDFPGTPGIDPSLNIEAVYKARTAGGDPLDIYAVVSGTLQSPRVSLRSDIVPPISESDLASYLFFGAPTSAFNFGSAATGEGGVFGGLGSRALAASGLGYFASGLQTLAQSFGLVDYVGLSAAEAAGPGAPQQGLGGLLAATRIELGRYLTPRLFVAYTQRLASENRGAGVRLEWRMTPTYTLEAFAEDRFARAPSFTLSQLLAARKVYGFFLYREWGY